MSLFTDEEWNLDPTGAVAEPESGRAAVGDPQRFQDDVEYEIHKHDVRKAALEAIEKRTPRRTIRDMMLGATELSAIPDVEPLIGDFLFRRSVAVLYGRRNVGKTFTALDMALCVATGKTWAEDKDAWRYEGGEDYSGFPVRKGNVLWIAGEGAFGIRGRVEAWKAEHGLLVNDFTVINGSLELASAERIAELAEIVAAEKYDLIVVDTLARNSAGLEENSASDMKVFFDHIDRLKAAHDGCAVLLVHHQGKGESTESRGSTVIEDAPDSVFRVSGDADTIFLETTKQRDTVKAPRITFRLEGRPEEGSAVILRGAKSRKAANEPAEPSQEEITRDVFLTHFRNTGATQTQWREALMEKQPMSRATANRRISDALEGWEMVAVIKGGAGRPDRYEVA